MVSTYFILWCHKASFHLKDIHPSIAKSFSHSCTLHRITVESVQSVQLAVWMGYAIQKLTSFILSTSSCQVQTFWLCHLCPHLPTAQWPIVANYQWNGTLSTWVLLFQSPLGISWHMTQNSLSNVFGSSKIALCNGVRVYKHSIMSLEGECRITGTCSKRPWFEPPNMPTSISIHSLGTRETILLQMYKKWKGHTRGEQKDISRLWLKFRQHCNCAKLVWRSRTWKYHHPQDAGNFKCQYFQLV